MGKRKVGVKDVAKNELTNITLFPNPVGSQGKLKFDLAKGVKVDLRIVDITGRVVMNKTFGQLSYGAQEVVFNAETLNPGTYHAVLTANGKLMGSELFLKK